MRTPTRQSIAICADPQLLNEWKKDESLPPLEEHALWTFIDKPVGTANVWDIRERHITCDRHGYSGHDEVWDHRCARLLSVQLANALNESLPTLEEVNRQRVLWQRRCDNLLDKLLCEYCMEDKDRAYAGGVGLDWRPVDCSDCRSIRWILEEHVFDEHDPTPPLTYDDERPQTMWRWYPTHPFFSSSTAD